MQFTKHPKAILEQGKALRKSVEYNQFLRKIIQVYSSPFIEPKYDYSELNALDAAIEKQKLDLRFSDDKSQILSRLLQLVGKSNFKRIYQLTNRNQDEETIVEVIILLVGDELAKSKEFPDNLNFPSEHIDQSTAKHNTNGISSKTISECILDQIIEIETIPRQFEFDYIDDLIDIVKSRYAGQEEKHWERSAFIFNLLKAAVGSKENEDISELPKKLKEVLGVDHQYVPKIGNTHPDVKKGIPDLFDELISVKAKENLPRFLEINKEYSFRQRQYHKVHSKGNPWGLPLIAGLEQDQHIMLRSIIKLKQLGFLTKEDEVLIVGPRYVDELTFFRKHLGFPKTIGLDLFSDDEEGIVAGDMHDTNFTTGRFGLLFCAGTLAYSYDFRKVIAEFTRIVKRPGFICLMDAGDRVNGVDPLGRSDPMGLDSMINCFYKNNVVIHAKDYGRSPFPSSFKSWPCVLLEVKE